MENWLTEIMNDYGYFGVFFLIALENIFPPIPSEVILTFGGFMTVDSGLTIPGVVAASTAGSVAGAIALYYIGVQLDVERLEKIIDRWGTVLRVNKEDLHRADAWFDKYGPWTVFFCRFVPLIRSLISIPAGMSNMNIWIFLGFTNEHLDISWLHNSRNVDLEYCVDLSWSISRRFLGDNCPENGRLFKCRLRHSCSAVYCSCDLLYC